MKYFDSQRGFFVENNALVRYVGKDDVFKIPDNITEIGRGAFQNCGKLKKVIVPSSVKRIGENAFWSCSGLEEIVLNEGLKEIGSSAFLGATKLKNLYVPSSVKKIGEYAFANCYSLKTVDIPEGLTLSSKLFTANDKTVVNRYHTFKNVLNNASSSEKKTDKAVSQKKIQTGKIVLPDSSGNDFIKKAQEFKAAYDAKVKLVADLEEQLAELEKEKKELTKTVEAQKGTIAALTAELEEVSRILSE